MNAKNKQLTAEEAKEHYTRKSKIILAKITAIEVP